MHAGRHCDTQAEVTHTMTDVVANYEPQWLKRPHNLQPYEAATLHNEHLTNQTLSIDQQYCFVVTLGRNQHHPHQSCCLSQFDHLTLLLAASAQCMKRHVTLLLWRAWFKARIRP